jgi:hypothetical protein
METIAKPQKWGIGSMAFFISIFATMFTFTSYNDISVGEFLLGKIGVVFPTAIISLILFCLSIAIAYKYRSHRLAKAGKIIAMIFILLTTILLIISLL